MYFFVFLVILLFVILEIKTRKRDCRRFYLVYTVLTLMITLRYAQGTDYYGYKVMYNEVLSISKNSFYPLLLMRDPGYLMLNFLAISFDISYEVFSSLFSLITMVVFYPFFSNVSKKSIIPLFFFYTTFFLIYPFSGVRQGFTLAILLGLLYPLLKQKKYILYVLITLLASTIHQSLLVCLLMPFIYNLNINTKIVFLLFIPLTFVMLVDFNIFKFLPVLSARVDNYLETESSMKYLAKLVRILVVLPIFLIPEKEYVTNKDLRGIRNILLSGYVIYSLLSFSELTSSRLAIYYRAFEGLFVLLLLYHTKLKKINYHLTICCVFFASIMFLKDINALIGQGKYANCNMFTYPYLSVFDDEQTIIYYRKYYGKNDVEL